MRPDSRHPRLASRLSRAGGRCTRWAALALAVAAVGVGGCVVHEKPTPPPEARYKPLPAVPGLPEFMHNTVYEKVRVENTDYAAVSNYSLAVNLHNTGDNGAIPTRVRDYIIKQMIVHKFGAYDLGTERLQPEQVLNDKRVAIVIVEGRVPPGARKGQPFDINVRAVPSSNTSSLAHGNLYFTDLYNQGILQPGSGGDVMARAEPGPIFVNPAYALTDGPAPSVAVKASLRQGIVMGAGREVFDRPIFLRLRDPQRSISRSIEYVIAQRFQSFKSPDPQDKVAAAEDEGLVQLFVPYQYNGDWEHFIGVATHLYLNNSTEYSLAKTRQLMIEAKKPDAKLMDISYCWEGMGEQVIPIYAALIDDPDPAVAYAAARAAAFNNDVEAQRALKDMASDGKNPFQLAAVQTLGALPDSPSIHTMLRKLLDSDQTLVRVEAYKILAAHDDPAVVSRSINGKFFLDIVDSHGGEPLIYATRTGVPRIAIFGQNPSIQLPVTFTAMNDQFSISSSDDSEALTLFYRDARFAKPVNIQSSRGIAEVIARLGGQSAPGDDSFDFNYGDIVAIVQALSDAHQLVDERLDHTKLATRFMLQRPPAMASEINSAPALSDKAAPQMESPRPQGGPATQPSAGTSIAPANP